MRLFCDFALIRPRHFSYRAALVANCEAVYLSLRFLGMTMALLPLDLGNLRLWKNDVFISNDLRLGRAIAQAILIPIATFLIWQLKLFPPPTMFCLDFRNGEAVKL